MRTLPAHLDEWRERFQLRDARPATVVSHNLILFGETLTGHPVVVKASHEIEQLAAEVEALRAFGEARAVAVHDVWLEEHAILLERVRPGASLASQATEDQAMQVVAQLLVGGWPVAPAGSVAKPLAELAGAIDRALARYIASSCALDYRRLQRANAILIELLDTTSDTVLLHGDLHYDNILTSDRAGHVMIDPKGMIGDAAFDVGYLVSRPAPCARDVLSVVEAIDRRLAFLPAATGQDPARVAAFAYVASALSAVWALEDGDAAWRAYAEVMSMLERRMRL